MWGTHFAHSAQFGLYEDDWARVPETAGISWSGLLSLVYAALMPGGSQGRPLHPGLIYLFSFIGLKNGGLPAIYMIAFGIQVINAILFHSFLLKAFNDGRLAFLGAIAFCVFPADTTQPFLTHGLGVQPAITLLLIAFHSYLSGWKRSSYVAVFLVLFTYETPFLVFSVAPMLHQRSKWEMRKHCAILTTLMLCALLYRSLTAENRVAHIGFREIVLGSTNIISGPLTCLAMYLYRPVEAATKMTMRDLFIVSLCLAVGVSIVIFKRALNKRSDALPGTLGNVLGHSFLGNDRHVLRVGAAMLLLAYPLTMTTIGISISGRGTRVHTAAVFGGSIVLAWVCSSFLSRPASRRGTYAAALCVACFFCLLIGFGLQVQKDYIVGWQEQRVFWTNLVALCPSLDDGDVIMVEPTGLPDTRQLLLLRKSLNGIPETRQIKSLDCLYDVISAIYVFPPEWKSPPRVFRLPLNWKNEIFDRNNRLRPLSIEAGYGLDLDYRAPVTAHHTILLDTAGGHLTRRSSIVSTLDSRQLQLKKDSTGSMILIKAAFYPYVIYPNGNSSPARLGR